MRVSIVVLALASFCGGCSCSPWGDPYPPKQPLPEEFEPCTENLRCAEGLECFVGGGECRDTPEFYSFCARPCEGNLDCEPSRCQASYDIAPFPFGYCRPLCPTGEDSCPTNLDVPWSCIAVPGVCVLDVNAFDCTPLDAGIGTTDAGP